MWEAIIWAIFSALLVFGGLAMTFNNYIMARICFFLAAFVPLARLSWWIIVEHHFGNRLLTYALLFGVFGVTSIALVYGSEWILDQEHKYKEQIIANTKIEKRVSILEHLQIQAAHNQEALEEKYPKGYTLFASEKHVIYVPINTENKSDFNLDWADSRISYVDSSYVAILLKNLHYYPTEIQVRNFTIVLERKVGNIARGLYFNNIGMFVEILDDKADEITYVIGCKAVESVPKQGVLKPEVAQFVMKLGIPLLTSIDTNTQKYLLFENLAISSGWTTSEGLAKPDSQQ
jgi:hypothetical protein